MHTFERILLALLLLAAAALNLGARTIRDVEYAAPAGTTAIVRLGAVVAPRGSSSTAPRPAASPSPKTRRGSMTQSTRYADDVARVPEIPLYRELSPALARFRAQPTEEHKRQINQIIRDEAPLVPLIYGQSLVVHSRKIRNVSMNATGGLTLSAVTES